jgi:hypothetical protein
VVTPDTPDTLISRLRAMTESGEHCLLLLAAACCGCCGVFLATAVAAGYGCRLQAVASSCSQRQQPQQAAASNNRQRAPLSVMALSLEMRVAGVTTYLSWKQGKVNPTTLIPSFFSPVSPNLMSMNLCLSPFCAFSPAAGQGHGWRHVSISIAMRHIAQLRPVQHARG